MTDPFALRVCSTCGWVKPTTGFFRDPHKASGWSSQCRDCQNLKKRSTYPATYRRGDQPRRSRRSPQSCFVRRSIEDLVGLACRCCGVVIPLRAEVETGSALCDPCREYRKRVTLQAGESRRRARRRQSPVRLRRSEVADILAAAVACPLCGVVMTDEQGPAKKNIDHIVPLGVGGKHVRENVRVICRTCNLARPHDGRDVVVR